MATDNDFKSLKNSLKEEGKAGSGLPKDLAGNSIESVGNARLAETLQELLDISEKFEDFYHKTIEEMRAAEDRTVKYNDRWGDKRLLGAFAGTINEIFQKRRKALYPKIHQYIRENGDQKLLFPTSRYGSSSYDIPFHEGILKSGTSDIWFPFHLLAADFPTGESDTYRFYEVEKKGENGEDESYSLLRTGLSKYRYTPEGPLSGGYYSRKYKELEEKRRSLQAVYDRLEDDVSDAKAGLELYSGFLPLGMLLVLPKLLLGILSAVFMNLWGIVVFFGVEILVHIFFGGGTVGNIVGGILLLIAVVLLCFVAYEEADDPFECFSDFGYRMKYRKELAQAKAALAREGGKAKADVEAFVASEEYRSAKAEEERLKKEDRELAERWQSKWAEQMRNESFKPGWLIV